MNKEFDGFYVGQRLMLSEFGATPDFLVSDIIIGGMGVCIKAINCETNEVFAIKGIQKGFLQEESAVQRFKKELDIWFVAASCDGVVDTKSIIMINGIPYMMSEWVPGGDLFARLPRMSPVEKIKVFIEIVDALRLVHGRYGIIHRDLKPQNVLVLGNGRPLIADWGLAKIYDNRLNEDDLGMQSASQTTTMAGSQMGTILYMSPEQILDSSRVDFRTDIYALGCILHELETGRPPFLGKSVKEIVNRHLYEAPPLLGGVFRKTALGMEKVINRCLQKKPADRYNSYSELLDELVKLASKRGVTAYTNSKIRYDRVLPSTGYDYYVKPLLLGKTKETPMLSIAGIDSVIEEANILVSTNRAEDAVKLLRPLICPDNIISKDLKWHGGTILLEIYAHALILSGRLEEAEHCYHSLGRFQDKPAVYYVNNSYLNILLKRPQRVVELCSEGLRIFPKDKDLLGNISTGYMMLGDIDRAIFYSRKRMMLGSIDVNDCEQMYNLLKMQTTSLRYKDLDAFYANMIDRWDAISRGLSLNPNWPMLHFAFVEYVSEINEHDGVRLSNAEFRNRIMEGELQHALVEIWAKNLKEIAWFSSKREVIINSINLIGARVNDKNLKLKYLTAVRDAYYSLILHFSAKKENAYDWLLIKENGKYRTPVEAAEILHKLGRKEESYEIVLKECDSPNWNANRVAVQLYLSDGECGEAINVAKKGVSIMPAHREAWQTLATAYEKAGMMKASEEALAHAKACWTKEKTILSDLQSRYHELFTRLCKD